MEPKAPTQSLYNDWEVSTEEGNRIFTEAINALEPIMKKNVEAGYPIRQIAHEMLSAVTMLEAETCIRRNMEMHKANRKPRFGVKETVPLSDLSTSKEGETQNG